MKKNTNIFNTLIRDRKIEIKRSDLFDHAPGPINTDSIFDRVEGMMIGLAIGDALGNTTESRLPGRRFKSHGEIRDYLPNHYAGPIWAFVDEKDRNAYNRNVPTVEACNSWYSGAFLLETVPCALYILMKHGYDPKEAIVRAVNDTRDNDTIAAIVGAAVGALHGKEKLPKRWVDNLLGRTSFDDDGRVFELLKEAKIRWFSG